MKKIILLSMIFLSITFAQKKQVYYYFADKEPYGPELVVNSDFSSDTWWSKTPQATISGGLGHITNCPSGSGFYKDGIITLGKTYRVTYTVSGLSGSERVLLTLGNLASGTPRTADGTYTENITCSSLARIYLISFYSNTTCDFDNISIREVLP